MQAVGRTFTDFSSRIYHRGGDSWRIEYHDDVRAITSCVDAGGIRWMTTAGFQREVVLSQSRESATDSLRVHSAPKDFNYGMWVPPDEKNLWVVGDAGKIYRVELPTVPTNDTSLVWHEEADTGDHVWRAIVGGGELPQWAVGYTFQGIVEGRIAERLPSGNWTVLDLGTAGIMSVWASGETDAWAVTVAAEILHFDGRAWSVVRS